MPNLTLQKMKQNAAQASAHLESVRDAIINATAPWLNGKAMTKLTGHKQNLETIIRIENEYNIVDQHGNTNPKKAWLRPNHFENPMVELRKEVETALPEQLQLNRDALVQNLFQYSAAATYLHSEGEQPMNRNQFQEILDAVDPFDIRIFTDYYSSDAVIVSLSEEQLKKLEDALITSATAAGVTIKSPVTKSDRSVRERLDSIEGSLRELAAANIDTGLLQDDFNSYLGKYQDRLKGLSANAALGSAECRNNLRKNNQQISDSYKNLAVGVGVIVVTAGVGSWLAAAKAGATASQTAEIGTAWAKAAKVSQLASRGAQALANSGMSYQMQARLLWGRPIWVGRRRSHGYNRMQ